MTSCGVQGRLALLNVGAASPLHSRLLMPGLELARTVLEADLGVPLADVFYFPSASPRARVASQHLPCDGRLGRNFNRN